MADPNKSAVFTPGQLHQLTEDTAMAEARRAFAERKKTEDHQKSLHEAFMAQQPHPDALERIMAAARHTAEQGKSEMLVLQFPASYLEDGGRKINNFESDWPTSLNGYAKRAFEFYEANLKSSGFKVRARILDFPDGKPGEVGIYLAW